MPSLIYNCLSVRKEQQEV